MENRPSRSLSKRAPSLLGAQRHICELNKRKVPALWELTIHREAVTEGGVNSLTPASPLVHPVAPRASPQTHGLMGLVPGTCCP